MKNLSVFILLILFPVFVLANDQPASAPQSVLQNLSAMLEWFDNASYEWADSILERVAAWYIVWTLDMKLFWLQLSLDISEGIVNSLGVSSEIQRYLSALDSEIANFVFWLKIPEAINAILSAYGVRIIMGMI